MSHGVGRYLALRDTASFPKELCQITFLPTVRSPNILGNAWYCQSLQFFFFILQMYDGISLWFKCLSLMSNNLGSLSIHSLVICMSSFIIHLSFHFLNLKLFLNIYSVCESSTGFLCCRHILPLCDLSFHSLIGVFGWT